MKLIEDCPRTLLDISLIKVTVCVCSSFPGCSPNSRKDKFNYQWKLHSHWSFDRCEKCIDMINRHVSLLKLPRELENTVAGLCRPIFKEIIAWNIGLKQLHSKIIPIFLNAECSCLDEVSLGESFQWNSSGSINGKKTAQKLIHDKRLDVRFRFLLACHYCFENDVVSLSKKMLEIPTSNIGSFTYTFLPLCAYWADWLRGGEINVNRYSNAINHFFFDNSYFSFIVSNATALRHFSQKLSPTLRSCFLTSIALCLRQNPEVMRYCLSEADEVQKEHIFRANPTAVLLSFVDWPWQRHFLEVGDRMWAFLKGRNFCNLIKIIFSKINAEWHDFDYTRLLTEYWKNSPNHLKEYVRNRHEDLMCDLINTIKMNHYVHDI